MLVFAFFSAPVQGSHTSRSQRQTGSQCGSGSCLRWWRCALKPCHKHHTAAPLSASGWDCAVLRICDVPWHMLGLTYTHPHPPTPHTHTPAPTSPHAAHRQQCGAAVCLILTFTEEKKHSICSASPGVTSPPKKDLFSCHVWECASIYTLLKEHVFFFSTKA